jgi:hypothetical protein
MEWGDISDKGRAWMRDLGNFGPTVNTRDRMVKGCMLDDDGEAARTYLDSADLRGLAAACNEVADWLDARAGGWIEWKGGECPVGRDRLIAAAPELLEALEALYEATIAMNVNSSDLSSVLEAEAALAQARATIAKATGSAS